MSKSLKTATAWKPGQSGNPKGRPKGSGIAGELRRAIEADSREIVAAMAERAKQGDPAAARLLLERCLPALKAEAQAVTVEGVDTGTLPERATAALDAAARGELAPDTAAELIKAVAGLARIVETDELERRLAALEQIHEQSKR